jgi:site-specific DNA-methyltransferase (adenine-specific)
MKEWQKGGGGIGDLEHSLSTDYEIAIVCHKGMAKIRGKRDGSVWSSPKIIGNRIVHPTEKPVNLIKRIIEKFSDEESVVLDSYLGSGTTAVACKQLNRNFIGIEISEEYCKIAEDRLNNMQPNLF